MSIVVVENTILGDCHLRVQIERHLRQRARIHRASCQRCPIFNLAITIAIAVDVILGKDVIARELPGLARIDCAIQIGIARDIGHGCQLIVENEVLEAAGTGVRHGDRVRDGVAATWSLDAIIIVVCTGLRDFDNRNAFECLDERTGRSRGDCLARGRVSAHKRGV